MTLWAAYYRGPGENLQALLFLRKPEALRAPRLDGFMLLDGKPKDPGACYELLRQPVAFLLLIDGAESDEVQRSIKPHVCYMQEFINKAQDSLISEHRKT